MDVLPPTGAVTEVRVIAGSGYDPRNRSSNPVLLTERDPARVRELVGLLGVLSPVRPAAWMQQPVLSCVLLAGRTPVVEIGLLDRRWIRAPEAGDLRLLDPDGLAGWLRSGGIPALPDG